MHNLTKLEWALVKGTEAWELRILEQFMDERGGGNSSYQVILTV